MVLNLNESVANEMFEKLVIAYNNLKDNNKLEVYLNSDGGDVEAAEAIIDFINEHSEVITLIANGSIFSSAFLIFFRTNCKKRILNGTVGMFHLIRVSIDHSENGEPYYKIDKVYSKWVTEQRKWTSVLCDKLKLTDKELKYINKGKEVYFTTERLNELLENARNF